MLGAQYPIYIAYVLRKKTILRPTLRERAHNLGTERRSGLELDNKLDDHPFQEGVSGRNPNEGISDQEAHSSTRLHPPTRDDLGIPFALRLAGSDSSASETRAVRVSMIDAQVIPTRGRKRNDGKMPFSALPPATLLLPDPLSDPAHLDWNQSLQWSYSTQLGTCLRSWCFYCPNRYRTQLIRAREPGITRKAEFERST